MATQSSSVTPSIGMNGITSAAPSRGCAPVCLVRSISSAALPTPRIAASATFTGSPTSVMTQRLWSASISRSSRYKQSIFMASIMASTRDLSRPSEKLGTHSTSAGITYEDNASRWLLPNLVIGKSLVNSLLLPPEREHEAKRQNPFATAFGVQRVGPGFEQIVE